MRRLLPLTLLLALTAQLPAEGLASWGGLFGTLFLDPAPKTTTAPLPEKVQPPPPEEETLVRLPTPIVPRSPADYDGTVHTDELGLRALLEGPEAWRFMAAGEASFYTVGSKVANTERYYKDRVSAAILGWFTNDDQFVYLPKAYPRGTGIPLLLVHEQGGTRRWMFVRWNDRGPYTGRRLSPVNQEHMKAMGEAGSRLKPSEKRPIDLSRGAMRKLMGALGMNLNQGLVKGVRIYLPPSSLLPEVEPLNGRKGAGRHGYTIRSMIDEAYATWPPAE